MKRIAKILSLVLALSLCLTALGGCATDSGTATDGATGGGGNDVGGSEGGIINVYAFTDEVPNMLERYRELHPDFNYEFNITTIATTEGAYQPALDQALSAGGANAPDIYCAEAAFVLKYTQGDAASYALPYKDLGISDVDSLLTSAQIAPYASEIGTNPNGEIVGLPFQATGGAFIYRRSIAQDVWGTDDTTTIKNKIGPTWDDFMAAAEELKAKGYAIVSGNGDLWHPLENSSEKPWIVDGKLFIDPAREQFLDLAKQLKDNDYFNGTEDWQDPWFADMKDAGPKKVFGFFGPAWLINYVMAGNSGGEAPGEGTYGDWAICEPTTGFSWGGTWLIANKDTSKKEAVAEVIKWITLDTSETGLQYQWANGTLYGEGGTKDTVASAAVMDKSDGTLDFLGGQNMFDIFVPAGVSARGDNKSQYDETINQIWRDQVHAYANGVKDRDAAIADFKAEVSSTLDIPSE